MTQSIAAPASSAHPNCAIPWCRTHIDDTIEPGFGCGAIHQGATYTSAELWTGHYLDADGVRVPQMETVRVHVENFTHPDPNKSEQAGVYVSGFSGRLSIEAAMDLAADLLRAASELVAAEIRAARGGAR